MQHTIVVIAAQLSFLPRSKMVAVRQGASDAQRLDSGAQTRDSGGHLPAPGGATGPFPAARSPCGRPCPPWLGRSAAVRAAGGSSRRSFSQRLRSGAKRGFQGPGMVACATSLAGTKGDEAHRRGGTGGRHWRAGLRRVSSCAAAADPTSLRHVGGSGGRAAAELEHQTRYGLAAGPAM